MADNNLKLKGYMQMNINLGEIREFTETDRKNLNANTAARHTHDNKNTLDKIKGIDNAPTKDSENVLTSGSVYDALTGKVNSKYLGGVDFNQIFEPGIYTVNINDSTNHPDINIENMYNEATFEVSPVNIEDDGIGGQIKIQNQSLIVIGYDDNAEVAQQYVRFIEKPTNGDMGMSEWFKIADSRGVGSNSAGVDLSNYVQKEDGKGLSKVVDVAMNTLNTEGLGRFDELNFVFADGSTDAVAYYNVTQMKAMLEEDVIEVDEKLEGKIDKKEVSESDIDSLSNVLGLSFYKVNPINGSLEHSYFMINSMDSGIGIVAATCFQMRFKETIETRIYDVETETWGNWTEISGSSGSLGSPLLDGVDLNQVFDAGMYVVGNTCTNLPDAIDFEVLDSPVVTMFVGYSEDEYYDLAHQIIFVTDCVGNSCVYQRQIERYKSSGSVTPYYWGTISSGGSGGGADLSEYVKNTDYATADKAGVVKVSGNDGIKVNSSGLLYITQASYDTIDAKQSKYYPITPFVLDYAVQACTNQDMNAELTEQQQKLPPSTASVKAYIEETLLGGAW